LVAPAAGGIVLVPFPFSDLSACSADPTREGRYPVDDTVTYYARRAPEYDRRFEIIKNFYDEAFFRQRLGQLASDVLYEALEYFWLVSHRLERG
jgi:hypothetical protein